METIRISWYTIFICSSRMIDSVCYLEPAILAKHTGPLIDYILQFSQMGVSTEMRGNRTSLCIHLQLINYVNNSAENHATLYSLENA